MPGRPEVSQESTSILSSSDSSGHASQGFSYLFINILCRLLIEDVIFAFFLVNTLCFVSKEKKKKQALLVVKTQTGADKELSSAQEKQIVVSCIPRGRGEIHSLLLL